MMIARVWRKHSLKPQRLDGYMASDEVVPTRRASRMFVFRTLTSSSHGHWATNSPVRSAIAAGCRSRGYSWQCLDVRLVC